MITNSREVGKELRRYVTFAAIVVALALSACVISVALASPRFRWLGWIGFLPLFIAMRLSRPSVAALAGALSCICSLLRA